MNEVVAKLHQMFVLLGYKWRIDGELATPTQEDIAQALDRAKELLYTEPVPSQLEIGRLIVQHYEHGKFNCYLHFGEIND